MDSSVPISAANDRFMFDKNTQTLEAEEVFLPHFPW